MGKTAFLSFLPVNIFKGFFHTILPFYDFFFSFLPSEKFLSTILPCTTVQQEEGGGNYFNWRINLTLTLVIWVDKNAGTDRL